MKYLSSILKCHSNKLESLMRKAYDDKNLRLSEKEICECEMHIHNIRIYLKNIKHIICKKTL